ncbi:hypothetical protein ACFPM0_01450 [Pseudonocardia sulfidoxydans]|uniref:hypothetical protein n=1 Tax=Pseudonocardia sulfidoxydans TaxID=54011 RepID=UPI00361258F1
MRLRAIRVRPRIALHPRATSLLRFGPGTTLRLRPTDRAQPDRCPTCPRQR